MSKKIELSIIVILFIFVVYCALIIGIPWDEGFEITRGKERLKYLFSFGSYDHLNYRDHKFYPGLYNTLGGFIMKIFPKKYEI